MGEDRRTVYVQHDGSWVQGFPMRLGHGGESQAVDKAGNLGRVVVLGARASGAKTRLPATGADSLLPILILLVSLVVRRWRSSEAVSSVESASRVV